MLSREFAFVLLVKRDRANGIMPGWSLIAEHYRPGGEC